jgi:hypothetical protein
MRFVTKLFVLLILICAIATGQERIVKFMAGPSGDETRIVVALTVPLEDGYKLQSMIINMSRLSKETEQPSFVLVDLTSTVRSLATGKKKQEAFIMRWNKTGQIELKCNGKWTRHDSNPGIEKVMEVTKSVIQNTPWDAKSPTELTLSSELEQKVAAILEGLKLADLPCLREEH